MKFRAKIAPIEAVQYRAGINENEVIAFFGSDTTKLTCNHKNKKFYVKTPYKQAPLLSLEDTDYVIRDIYGNYIVEAQSYFESRYEGE